MTNPQKLGRHMFAVRCGERWTVMTSKGQPLGDIEWHAKWRQYEFCPHMGMAFTHDCLAELSAFLVRLNGERRAT